MKAAFFCDSTQFSTNLFFVVKIFSSILHLTETNIFVQLGNGVDKRQGAQYPSSALFPGYSTVGGREEVEEMWYA